MHVSLAVSSDPISGGNENEEGHDDYDNDSERFQDEQDVAVTSYNVDYDDDDYNDDVGARVLGLGRCCYELCPCNPIFSLKAFQVFLLFDLYGYSLETVGRTILLIRGFDSVILQWWKQLFVILVGGVGLLSWIRCCRKTNTTTTQASPTFLYIYGPPAMASIFNNYVLDYCIYHKKTNIEKLSNSLYATQLVWFVLLGKIINPTRTYSWMRCAQIIASVAVVMAMQITAPSSPYFQKKDESWTVLQLVGLLIGEFSGAFIIQWYSRIWTMHGDIISVWHVMAGVYTPNWTATTIQLLFTGDLGKVHIGLSEHHYISLAAWYAIGILAEFWIIRHLGPVAMGFVYLMLQARRTNNPNPILIPLWAAVLLWVVIWEFVDQFRKKQRLQQQHQLIPTTIVEPEFQDSSQSNNDDDGEEEGAATEMTSWANSSGN